MKFLRSKLGVSCFVFGASLMHVTEASATLASSVATSVVVVVTLSQANLAASWTGEGAGGDPGGAGGNGGAGGGAGGDGGDGGSGSCGGGGGDRGGGSLGVAQGQLLQSQPRANASITSQVHSPWHCCVCVPRPAA